MEITKEFIGKKILSIISLDLTDQEIRDGLSRICENDYEKVEQAKLILMEDNTALVFVSFDDDGYRSGNWNFLKLKNVLDKGFTKEIKTINSKIISIENFTESKNYSNIEGILITTENYLIKMGQDGFDDYYPANFFDIEECRNFVLGDAIKIK